MLDRLLLSLLLSLACALSLQAQGNITFVAAVNDKQIAMGGYFELTFTLSNAMGRHFKPPAFQDFILLSGPNQAVQSSMVNGNVSHAMTITYVLQPRKTGKFTLGEASIVANGRTYYSRPVQIEVVNAPRTTARNSKGLRIFLQAIPSTTEAFPGQQVVLDYKLYTSVPVENTSLLSESKYSGFYAQDIRRAVQLSGQETLNGVRYNTAVIKRVALFPQQEGELTIDAMQLELLVADEDDPLARRGFFGGLATKVVPVQSDPVRIRVRALPPAPAGFCGAVGTTTASAALSKAQVRVGEMLTLRVHVSGNSDVRRFQLPAPQLSDSLELFDPRPAPETVSDNGAEVYFEKDLDFQIVPKAAGKYVIRMPAVYFDPAKARYVSLVADTFALDVQESPVSAQQRQANPDDTLLQPDSLDRIRNNMTWRYLLPLTLLAVVAGYFTWRWWRRRAESMRVSVPAGAMAGKVALKRLERAHVLLTGGSQTAFYEELSRALQEYLRDKLEIPQARLTREQIANTLAERSVPDDLSKSLFGLLDRCDLALFAGAGSSGQEAALYREALAFIDGAEQHLRG